MAYEEYTDLFINAQETDSKYRLFTFDIVDSKKMNKNDRYIAQYDIRFLIERVYFDIKELEKTLNKSILIKEPGFGRIYDTSIINDFCFRYEPFLFGDTVGLTIYNNSIEPDIIYEIFEANKKEMNLKYSFHKSNILYQTHDYEKANKEYFRGYAILMSQNLHKAEKVELLKYLKSNAAVDSNIIDNYMNIVKTNHDIAVKNAIKLLSENNDNFLAGLMDDNGRYIIEDPGVNKEYVKRLNV